jgi:hypothetical protein
MNHQKPTNIDCHIEYTCPKKSCQCKLWISLAEARVRNFKIVCDCGKVFKPKRIKNIKIIYDNPSQSRKLPKVPANNPNCINGVPIDIMEACVKVLDNYGFIRTESIELVSKAYALCEDKNTMNILKKTLTLLEINNV